jgi:threonyl-tRNA synthetase
LAVTTLFPETQLGIGPPVENGFYYDFYRKNPFTTEDLEKIEQKMLEFVQQDLPFSRSIHEKSEGLEWFRKQGAELKCELIQEKADKQFSCYTGRHAGGLLSRAARPFNRKDQGSQAAVHSRAPIGRATNTTSSFSAFTARPSSRRRSWTIT